MTELSRRKKQKSKKPVIDKEKTKQKLNTGLNAFQRTLAIVGGILGLITASITIYTFMNRNNPSNGNSNPVQTIIRQIQGNPEPTSSSSQVETGNSETIPSSSETPTPSESSSQEPTLETNSSITTEAPIANSGEGPETE
ncbi:MULTISPECIES: DUF6556 family protein [unclassified Streptococcus]|uniref:DUF6556 family protein n=1 Tax=unclassified Streptococcus TaxID=2608887 RepID=UPI001072C057|nr:MULTISPECIES: DUF6556 family protein [unclassified Streptococcus]MBF0806248.1 hypothetical protein [Streptococcus sp. 19428wA2_WM07]TFU28158.1 hypothetical protein E4T71_05495 [Streptococcus sp. WM07]